MADFLKGLIKLAAAGVKHREGNPGGVRSHVRRAAELWRGIATTPEAIQRRYLGFSVEELIELANDLQQRMGPQRG